MNTIRISSVVQFSHVLMKFPLKVLHIYKNRRMCKKIVRLYLETYLLWSYKVSIWSEICIVRLPAAIN